MANEGNWKVVLENITREKLADVRDEVIVAFHLGQSQANDIVNNIPLILFEGLSDEDEANIIKGRLSSIIANGGDIRVTNEALSHTLKLSWPGGLPRIAQVGSGASAQIEEDEEDLLTIAKYDFVINEERVFACPSCGASFLLKELSDEEKQEAFAQAEIRKLLADRQEKEPASVEKVAVSDPSDDLDLLQAASESLEELDDVPAPRKKKKKEEDIMDFAAFEKGLDKISPTKPKAGARRRPAPRPKEEKPVDLGPLEHADDQEIFDELEELPDTKGELEPLSPEDAASALDKEKKKPPASLPKDQEKIKEITEFVSVEPEKTDKKAPGRIETVKTSPAAKKSPPKEPVEMTDIIEETPQKPAVKKKPAAEKKKKPAPSPRGPSGTSKKDEKPAEEPDEGPIELEEGECSLVLSKINAKDKKAKAAEIIAEIKEIDEEQALEMTEKLLVKVVAGVSKESAEALQKRFKAVGVASRITSSKSSKRISDRLQKK